MKVLYESDTTLNILLQFKPGSQPPPQEPESCGLYLVEVLTRNHYAIEKDPDIGWSWQLTNYRPDWPEGMRWDRLDETMEVNRWAKLPSEEFMSQYL